MKTFNLDKAKNGEPLVMAQGLKVKSFVKVGELYEVKLHQLFTEPTMHREDGKMVSFYKNGKLIEIDPNFYIDNPVTINDLYMLEDTD